MLVPEVLKISVYCIFLFILSNVEDTLKGVVGGTLHRRCC